MNILLIGILILLVAMTVMGHKKGFIRKLVGIVGWLITLWLAAMALPSVTEFLKESTSLYGSIQARIVGSDVELMRMLQLIGLGDVAGGFVAEKVVKLIAFVITFILVSVVVHGITGVLHIASKLPLIKGVNQKLGAVVGLLEGLFLVFILFLVIGACSTSTWGVKAVYMVTDSNFLTWLFVHNPLLLLLAS